VRFESAQMFDSLASSSCQVVPDALQDLSAPECAVDPRQAILGSAVRIRAFETGLLDLFKEGLIFGTVHTCVGQELCAAALHPHLQSGRDAFFATHRGHGHFLAHGGAEDALLAELMGRKGALCLGRGGTQNLRFRRFYSAGIQGGSAPIAVGFAFALRQLGENGIAVAQLGDGTFGEGTLYEAFTFAAWLRAPVLFLLERNGWAQSTDISATTPGDIPLRAQGFGLETHVIDDRDPAALSSHLAKVVAHVRRGNPFLQIIETRRLLAHSKGDDHRPSEVIAQLWREDPVARALETDTKLQRLHRIAQDEMSALAHAVTSRPFLTEAEAPVLPCLARPTSSRELHAETGAAAVSGRIAEELNGALHEILAECPQAVMIGEDLLDPYGGAFKVAKGLSTRFPHQVLSTPIAEAAIVGTSNGMALAGLRPIAEIMFADFVTLAADQLINFAAKFHYMYGQDVECPLTLRLVSGAGRGYGPTHSQSLERLFCGVPGLRVIALSQRHSPRALLRRAVLEDNGPTIFVENKQLYAQRLITVPPLDLKAIELDRAYEDYPPLVYGPADDGCADVTIVTYGGLTATVEAAMRRMIEEQELRFDYFVLTQLWPKRLESVVQSAARTGRLVVVEEAMADFGVAASVISEVAQQVRGVACRAVGAASACIPAVRHLEDRVLPSVDRVATAIRQVA